MPSPQAGRRFLGVTFCAALVLLLETVLFHLLEYIHDFFVATSVIGYTVLGIGLGAFAASRVRQSPPRLFFLACIGTTLGLYATSWVLVRYPVPLAIAAATAATVFFPVTYITVLFRDNPGGRVYLYDMAGAFAGVVMTVLLYGFLSSESIITLLLAGVPLVGLCVYLASGDAAPGRPRRIAYLVAAPLIVAGGALLTHQLVYDSLNLFRIFDRSAPHASRILKNRPPSHLAATYDSLVGRIDILKAPGEDSYLTAWNGRVNDYFSTWRPNRYPHYKSKGIRWPAGDQRVLYGLTEAPRVFIVGSAARGITKTVKRITPTDHIVPVEIQPGIIRAMTRDFVQESGNAYGGLKPVLGNAISVLKASETPFDIITLINTHSGRNIGTPSGPDFLHTAEQYDLYLDHLSESGYILFEERPRNRGGELGLYRMLNTLWHVLRERGSPDPSRHFLIWEWIVGHRFPEIDKRYAANSERLRYEGQLYVGMIVTREPLVGALRDKALAWYHDAANMCRVGYLKDYLEVGEWSDVFRMLERGDLSPLEQEGFDASIVTTDRPFPSLSRSEVPEVSRLVRSSAIVCLVLGLLFLVGTFWRTSARRAAFLGGYNVLIGFGYFLIEIALLHAYVNLFVSPSWSLVLVLGFLLVSSGIGGVLTGRLKSWQVAALLLPTAVAAIHAPALVLAWGLPTWLGKVIGVTLICLTGLLMGFYFPRGLVVAAGWSLERKIPGLFALNSVAGAFAVVAALWAGINVGYQATVMLAVLLYCAAGLMASATEDGGSSPRIENTPGASSG